MCKVSSWNFSWLRFYRGSNFPFSYSFLHGPYNSAAACDTWFLIVCVCMYVYMYMSIHILSDLCCRLAGKLNHRMLKLTSWTLIIVITNNSPLLSITRRCLSFVSEFKFDGFSADTCRSLVAMKDVSFKTWSAALCRSVYCSKYRNIKFHSVNKQF